MQRVAGWTYDWIHKIGITTCSNMKSLASSTLNSSSKVNSKAVLCPLFVSRLSVSSFYALWPLHVLASKLILARNSQQIQRASVNQLMTELIEVTLLSCVLYTIMPSATNCVGVHDAGRECCNCDLFVASHLFSWSHFLSLFYHPGGILQHSTDNKGDS